MPKNRKVYQKTLIYRIGHAEKLNSICHAFACLLYDWLVLVLLLRVLHLEHNLSLLET